MFLSRIVWLEILNLPLLLEIPLTCFAYTLFCGMRFFNPGITVALLAFFLVSCSDMVDPEFEDVENFKLGKVNLDRTTVSADIRLRNPNRFGLHLKNISCDVYMDSAHLGYFENSADIKIPREASFGLPVNGEIQTLKLMDYSKKALFGEPAYIRVNGQARVGRFGIYRTVPFEYRDTIKIKL